MAVEPKDKLLSNLRAALADGSFVKLTLSGYRGRDRSLKNVFIRPVELRGAAQLQFTYRHATNDIAKNFSHDDALVLLDELIGADFRTADLFTTARAMQLEFREGKAARLIEGKAQHREAPVQAHDQPKQRAVSATTAPWLHALGVTAPDGKVAKGMEAKFRQINRFVELLSHLFTDARLAANRRLTLVDMGSGKGYLTFAAFDWLRRSGWSAAGARGIETRLELVELCNRVAKENIFSGLHFEAGTIAGAALEACDVLIALHACNTATDDAIAKGIRAGAALIVVAPCCHKELRPQLNPAPVLAEALKHGIFREREAEFVTDALRAALLEWAGYDTKVFEFIATEHTSKNLMIAAVKRADAGDREARALAARKLAAFYGITTQRLAENLGVSLK